MKRNETHRHTLASVASPMRWSHQHSSAKGRLLNIKGRSVRPVLEQKVCASIAADGSIKGGRRASTQTVHDDPRERHVYRRLDRRGITRILSRRSYPIAFLSSPLHYRYRLFSARVLEFRKSKWVLQYASQDKLLLTAFSKHSRIRSLEA